MFGLNPQARRDDEGGDDTVTTDGGDDTRTDEIEEEPIALPGHSRPPAAAYHGPQFPPQVRCASLVALQEHQLFLQVSLYSIRNCWFFVTSH